MFIASFVIFIIAYLTQVRAASTITRYVAASVLTTVYTTTRTEYTSVGLDTFSSCIVDSLYCPDGSYTTYTMTDNELYTTTITSTITATSWSLETTVLDDVTTAAPTLTKTEFTETASPTQAATSGSYGTLTSQYQTNGQADLSTILASGTNTSIVSSTKLSISTTGPQATSFAAVATAIGVAGDGGVGMSVGAKAGIAVAAVLGAAVSILVALWIICHRRRKVRQLALETTAGATVSQSDKEVHTNTNINASMQQTSPTLPIVGRSELYDHGIQYAPYHPSYDAGLMRNAELESSGRTAYEMPNSRYSR